MRRLPDLRLIIIFAVIIATGGISVAFAILPGDDHADRTPSARIMESSPTPLPTLDPSPTPVPPTATPAPTTAPSAPAPTAMPSTSAPRPTTAPRPPPPATAIDPCAPPEVAIQSNFTQATYQLTGATVDELNASLMASPLSDSEGERAVALTEYSFRLTGARCARAGSCAVGQMTIALNGKVTLPKWDPPAGATGALITAWTNFMNKTSVHEGRHVTIAKEGADDLKNQLLAIGPRVNCEELDHQIDIAFRLATEAVGRRQLAFHVADKIGVGGVVAR